MTFICKVEIRPDTVLFLERNRGNKSCASLLHCILSDSFVISTQHESALVALREHCKGSESPFIDPRTKSRMSLVRRAAKRRCHFKLPNGAAGGSTTSTLQHQRIQAAIAGIGQQLNQNVTLELLIEVPKGPEHYQRCDVVWMPSGIAWEVDLSHKPIPDQRKRHQVRRNAGYTMISVADRQNTSSARLDYVPRVTLADLKSAAESKQYLSKLRVTNAAPWDEVSQDWQADLKRHPTFGSLCRGILDRSWSYGNVSVRNSKFFQWSRQSDLVKAGMQPTDIFCSSDDRDRQHAPANTRPRTRPTIALELRRRLRATFRQCLHDLCILHLAVEQNDVARWRTARREVWRRSDPVIAQLLSDPLPTFGPKTSDQIRAAMNETTTLLRCLDD